MRILHFSDIHISVAWTRVPWRKWLGKRALAVVNLLAGRARKFAQSGAKVEALARFSREQDFDLVLFSGDYTALGLDAELAAAREAVEPLMTVRSGYVNVPGNHDLYLRDTLRERLFERHFGDTLRSDLPERTVDGPWPVVRLPHPEVAVIALNSARPNPLPWRSSGRLPPLQLVALRELLRDPRLSGRHVLVVNHYPPLLGDGSRDRPLHRLVNDEELLDACSGMRGAILAGHVHHRYAVRRTDGSPWVLCSGSTTYTGREGLWVLDVEGGTLRATPGGWDGTSYALSSRQTIELD